MDNNTDRTVLVTGATGFIAQHCIVQLLETGFSVRGTTRSKQSADGIGHILAPHLSPDARQRLGTNLRTVTTDLTSDVGWDEAIAGCRYVLHVASPIPRVPPKDENELIGPAREGTLRVLRAS